MLIWNSSQTHWQRSMMRQRTTPWMAGIGPLSIIATSHAVPVIQSRRVPWRLAIDQALRATRVELEHPVTHDLQCHAADRGRLCPGRPIIDRRQCEKAAHLPGMLALTCRFTHPGCVEIGPQCDRHGEPPVFAGLESDHARVGESPNESRSAGPGIILQGAPIAPLRFELP